MFVFLFYQNSPWSLCCTFPGLALILPPCLLPGSPFREEITQAILQLHENNRLEILKRGWWDGGQCPKEEDHRAKGELPFFSAASFSLMSPLIASSLSARLQLMADVCPDVAIKGQQTNLNCLCLKSQPV